MAVVCGFQLDILLTPTPVGWILTSYKSLYAVICSLHMSWMRFPVINWWCFAYRIYPGVSDALKFASSKVFIVTTKQVNFALYPSKGTIIATIESFAFSVKKNKRGQSNWSIISEPICWCFTSRACWSNHTIWKDIWSGNWVSIW